MAHAKRMAGFTLIELLMVIVVIAILVAILLPVLNSSKKPAKERQLALDRKTIATAIFTFEQDVGCYPIPNDVCGDYSNNNFLVVDILANPTNAVKYIDPGAYRKTDNKSLKNPYGQPYCISFPNKRTALVDGQNVRDM